MNVILAFLFLFGLAFLIQEKWEIGGAAHFAAFLVSLCWIYCAALLRCMGMGGAVWYAGIAGLLVLYGRRHGAKKAWLRFRAFAGSMPSIFYTAGSALFFVVLAYHQPVFSTWDEFSFWGVAAKITSVTDELYLFQPGAYLNAVTPPAVTPPGVILIGYLFQFWNAEFMPWQHYAAIDIFCVSALTPLLALVQRKKYSCPGQSHGGAGYGDMQWAYGFLLLFSGLMVPFLCTATQAPSTPGSTLRTYLACLADVPLAFCMAGALALYLVQPKRPFYWLALFFLPLIKDIGFAYALLDAGILCALLVFSEDRKKLSVREKAAGVSASLVLPVLSYFGWSYYRGAVLSQNPMELGGEENMSMVQMMLTGLKELLIPSARSEKFQNIFSALWQNYLHKGITVFGTGLMLTAVCLMLFLIAFLFSEKGKRSRPFWLAAGTSAACFAYMVFLGFTYVYIFRGGEGEALAEYDRYVSSFYMAWLLIALNTLAGCIRLRCIVPKAAAVCFAGFGILVFWVIIGPDHTLFAPSSRLFDFAVTTRNAAVGVRPYVQDANVLYLSQGDDGSEALRWSYELFPARIQGSPVGTVCSPQVAKSVDAPLYAQGYTCEELASLISEGGYEWVLVRNTDEHLQEYYPLFSDGGASLPRPNEKMWVLYRVQHTSAGPMLLFEESGVM